MRNIGLFVEDQTHEFFIPIQPRAAPQPDPQQRGTSRCLY